MVRQRLHGSIRHQVCRRECEHIDLVGVSRILRPGLNVCGDRGCCGRDATRDSKGENGRNNGYGTGGRATRAVRIAACHGIAGRDGGRYDAGRADGAGARAARPVVGRGRRVAGGR